jgi:heme-degrading monooxygenase HmoA
VRSCHDAVLTLRFINLAYPFKQTCPTALVGPMELCRPQVGRRPRQVDHTENKMIRSILKLKPKSGQAPALVSYFKEQDIVGNAMSVPGCLSVEVQTRIPDEADPDCEDIVVTALWSSIESYEAWLSSQERQRSGTGMLPLLATDRETVASARLYRVEPPEHPDSSIRAPSAPKHTPEHDLPTTATPGDK